VHQFGVGSVRRCPCTALASRGDEKIATVGEDGCLVILALETARSRYDTVYRIGLSPSLLCLVLLLHLMSFVSVFIVIIIIIIIIVIITLLLLECKLFKDMQLICSSVGVIAWTSCHL